uniref:Uncharacterized protein n=1 Tax=Triticum urartu TaxID=4572 RepID=A0A8R7UII1_TRIUA
MLPSLPRVAPVLLPPSPSTHLAFPLAASPLPTRLLWWPPSASGICSSLARCILPLRGVGVGMGSDRIGTRRRLRGTRSGRRAWMRSLPRPRPLFLEADAALSGRNPSVSRGVTWTPTSFMFGRWRATGGIDSPRGLRLLEEMQQLKDA